MAGALARYRRSRGASRFSSAQVTLDLPEESLDVDGLGDVSVEARGQDLFPVAGHGTSREGHERDVLCRRIGLQASGQLLPVHPRNLDVQEDQVGTAPPHGLKSRDAIGSPYDLIALVLQDRLDELQIERTVLHDEDALLRHRRFSFASVPGTILASCGMVHCG